MCAPDHLPDPLLPNPMGDASEQPPHGLSSVYDSDSRCIFFIVCYHTIILFFKYTPGTELN